MEKLTVIGDDGKVYRTDCTIGDGDAWDKLGAYEDTGISPAEISDLKATVESLRSKLKIVQRDRDQWKQVAVESRDHIQPELRSEIKKASDFIARACRNRADVEGGIPYCSADMTACDGCEHIWRDKK